MRLNLKVPFAEKDQAKKLGARWDAARKVWYIDDKLDAAPFARWSPVPHDPAAAAPPAAARSGAKARTASSGVHTGVRYVARPQLCACPPWDVCDACRAHALTR